MSIHTISPRELSNIFFNIPTVLPQFCPRKKAAFPSCSNHLYLLNHEKMNIYSLIIMHSNFKVFLSNVNIFLSQGHRKTEAPFFFSPEQTGPYHDHRALFSAAVTPEAGGFYNII